MVVWVTKIHLLYIRLILQSVQEQGSWIIDGTLANIAWAPSLVSHNLPGRKIRTWNAGKLTLPCLTIG